jgi:hypothetical protein
MELIELVAEGDTVVVSLKCRGTHEEPWRGTSLPAGPCQSTRVFFFRFDHGLISEMWDIEDTWMRKRQLSIR